MMRGLARRAGPLWLAGLAACAEPAPRPIVLDGDACAHCHMIVADERYGGELVMETGRVLVFDDAGCLAAWVREGREGTERVHSLWVVDFLRPGTLIPAEEATYLRSDSLRTPMSFDLVAVAPGPPADSLARRLSATPVSWAELLARPIPTNSVSVRPRPRHKVGQPS